MAKSKKKNKRQTYLLSERKAKAWFTSANLFARSLLSMKEAIHEYNLLSLTDKLAIKQAIIFLHNQRKMIMNDIPKDEINERYINSVFVDSHIISTDYNTDPVVVLMCANPPCPLSSKIIIKRN